MPASKLIRDKIAENAVSHGEILRTSVVIALDLVEALDKKIAE